MNPIGTFDEISKAVLDNDYDCITMGILLADAEQREAKEYIINYMNRFDKRSGNYIDFYIPGYFIDCSQENAELKNKYHHNSYVKLEEHFDKPVFELERTGRKYYFDRRLFERFLEEMETEMGIMYTYNPMLILIEVCKDKCRGELSFQRKIVIELDEDTNRGLRRSGELFDKIFELSKKYLHFSHFQRDMGLYYLKGKAVGYFIKALNGDWIEVLAEVGKDLIKCRIK